MSDGVVQGQNLSGNWTGICKKEGNEFSFKAEAKIEQQGDKIDALLRIAYPDNEWFCIQKVEGSTNQKHPTKPHRWLLASTRRKTYPQRQARYAFWLG